MIPAEFKYASPKTIPEAVALPFVDDFLPVHNLVRLEMLVAKLSTLDETRPSRRQKPRVNLPTDPVPLPQRFMELPQMGRSDYVRRTMVLRTLDGLPNLSYDDDRVENPRG